MLEKQTREFIMCMNSPAHLANMFIKKNEMLFIETVIGINTGHFTKQAYKDIIQYIKTIYINI